MLLLGQCSINQGETMPTVFEEADVLDVSVQQLVCIVGRCQLALVCMASVQCICTCGLTHTPIQHVPPHHAQQTC
jgi:hypothetical protein